MTFRPQANTPLQSTMKENMRKMKADTHIYVSADKTANFYKVDPDKYNELLEKSITKDYKKAKDEILKTLT